MLSRRSVSSSRYSRNPVNQTETIKPAPRRPSPYSRFGSRNAETARPATKVADPTHFGDTLILSNQGITSASQILITDDLKGLVVKNNKLPDFVGFMSSQTLETLDISSNPIGSLRGFPRLPNLKSIDLSKTPFARSEFYRIAVIIVCGRNIRVINGERISTSERQIAKSYPAECEALIRSGWIPTYPPPRPNELSKIRAEVTRKQTDAASKVVKAPVLTRRVPQKQSERFEHEIATQAAELAQLEHELETLKQQAPRPKKRKIRRSKSVQSHRTEKSDTKSLLE